jgi:hypothetical protein
MESKQELTLFDLPRKQRIKRALEWCQYITKNTADPSWCHDWFLEIFFVCLDAVDQVDEPDGKYVGTILTHFANNALRRCQRFQYKDRDIHLPGFRSAFRYVSAQKEEEWTNPVLMLKLRVADTDTVIDFAVRPWQRDTEEVTGKNITGTTFWHIISDAPQRRKIVAEKRRGRAFENEPDRQRPRMAEDSSSSSDEDEDRMQ